MMTPVASANEKQAFIMYRQPIPIDRLCVYDVSPAEASGIPLSFLYLYKK